MKQQELLVNLSKITIQAGNHPQAKLIRCTQGKILDIAVDIRAHSPTFGEYVSLELSEDTMRQVYIPVGFAHGFLVLSDTADLQYKTTDYYSPSDEGSIHWSDEDLSIPWPIEHPIVSNRDMGAMSLKQYLENPAFIYAN
jgi:dTDP-4-dehydrorhamnose 3,5-epimerase